MQDCNYQLMHNLSISLATDFFDERSGKPITQKYTDFFDLFPTYGFPDLWSPTSILSQICVNRNFCENL